MTNSYSLILNQSLFLSGLSQSYNALVGFAWVVKLQLFYLKEKRTRRTSYWPCFDSLSTNLWLSGYPKASEKSIERKVIAEQEADKKGLQAFHRRDYWFSIWYRSMVSHDLSLKVTRPLLSTVQVLIQNQVPSVQRN
ncbi:hypothetical protein Bca101_009668 [Brassica carinata]